MPSSLLTHEVCSKAISLVRPAIEEAAKTGLIIRATVHIVIANPLLKPGSHELEIVDDWIDAGGILHEETVTDGAASHERIESYIRIARLKAFLSWRTGRTTSEVQSMPHLYQLGDVTFPGSAILKGLIVGTSGVQSHFDEAISYAVAAFCSAMCLDLIDTEKAPIEDGLLNA